MKTVGSVKPAPRAKELTLRCDAGCYECLELSYWPDEVEKYGDHEIVFLGLMLYHKRLRTRLKMAWDLLRGRTVQFAEIMFHRDKAEQTGDFLIEFAKRVDAAEMRMAKAGTRNVIGIDSVD